MDRMNGRTGGEKSWQAITLTFDGAVLVLVQPKKAKVECAREKPVCYPDNLVTLKHLSLA